MRMSVLGLILPLLTVAACGDRAGGDAGDEGAWPADRTFLSTSVTEQDRERPLVPGTRIELRFAADGTLQAQAGCNHLGGPGRIDGDRLVVAEMSTTDMGCDPPRMAQDSWLGDFLGARPAWRLAGDELVLRGGGTEIRLSDRRVVDPDRPLTGTRWQLDTLVTGQAASSLPAGTEAELRFDGNGFRASTGCSTLTGAATVQGGKILVTSVHRAAPSCTGERAAVETAILGVLRGEVGYRIEGPYLTLTGAGGKGLRLRAEDRKGTGG